MAFVKILLPLPKMFLLDYLVPNGMNVEIGDIVLVPFRNVNIVGIVWAKLDHSEITRLKEVVAKLDIPFSFSSKDLQFMEKASKYYLTELGNIAKLTIPVDLSILHKFRKQIMPDKFSLPDLSLEQQQVLDVINCQNKPIVIKGVTGSGKTEIYFHLVSQYIRQGKQALIMLPEIALSTQIIKRFIDRFGFEPVVWNSTVTKAQKRMILIGMMRGEIKVIIGARSALFLPYKELGLIVVDEEHDSSYKQDDGTLYNARDMAVLRSAMCGAKVLLCSATPSIETIVNAKYQKYHLVELQSRYKSASMPVVKVVDMRAENLPKASWISESLKLAIKDALVKEHQVLLFLNRRGYSPLMLCKTCGYRFTCNSCSSWLVMHKSTARLECHHCGYRIKIPNACPECNDTDSLCSCGPGVERVEEEIKLHFPNARIAMVSKDYYSSPGELETLLLKVSNREIDILIGTQIITKGYHFPYLTLVGVIDADLGLCSSDLRSLERTFQLLHQVSGRAGREHRRGEVLLQTYSPDNPVISALESYDEENFINYELESRRLSDMPPFTKMASIILSGTNEEKVVAFAKKVVASAPQVEHLRILGPAQSGMLKVSGKYRYRILLIAEKQFNIQKYITHWMGAIKVPSYCHLKVDIDPQSFY
jgi:primosomal protein N' (replication factor Y)